MRLIAGWTLVVCSVPLASSVGQQVPGLTRAQAVAAAVAYSPRLAAARADTAAAAARVTTAGAVPDPTLSASYTKDIPRYHVTLGMPLDQLWLGGIRVRAARAGQAAAQYRQRYEVAAVMLDADTIYTRALAALAHSRLSTRNAEDVDSLRRMAIARRDAGDASDLDVELATLAAGQEANAASADSVTASITLRDLQGIIGVPIDGVSTLLADSLDLPSNLANAATVPSAGDAPLLVASSAAALQSATLAAQVAHRSALGSPGLLVGFDTGDPTGQETGLLPTIGLAIPLPLFNRNRGPIAEADAERTRAAAELEVARVESGLQISEMRSTVLAADARVTRDRQLLISAERVTAMSLTAYREGAAPLASVLEAQRSARDVRTQYIDDVANTLVAAATLRLVTITPTSATP